MLFPTAAGATLGQLFDTLPQIGTVTWLGVRPARRSPLRALTAVEALADQGLAGDHYQGQPGSKRQVTLIQAEHLATVASLLHRAAVEPGVVRRNIVVTGLNLLALKGRQFRVGEVVLQMTGLCHPCSRMEESLGPGGYNAMRGHGGITARILQGGRIQLGDRVQVII